MAVRRSRLADPGSSSLELAHESLIGSWHTLSRWLDEGKEELAMAHEVAQAAEEAAGGRRQPLSQ